MKKALGRAGIGIAAVALALAATGLLMFAFVQSAEAQTGPRSVGSKLEVAISDSGRTIVRGAEVLEVSGDTIRARTEWGSSSLTWNIETDSDTDFVLKSGAGSDRDDIEAGDYVSFSGMLDGSGSLFTVDADVVKNWSQEDNAGRDRIEARAEAKAEVKAGFGNWLRGWFGNR